jgi:crossover junction endodeoxyribonuclease RusA
MSDTLFELEQPKIATLAPIAFTVFGHPQTAGSKKGFFNKNLGRVMIVDDNSNSRVWKEQVSSKAREEYTGDLLRCPIKLTLTFYAPRPKGHMGTRGLRASAPPYPITRPDVLKLARAVEDALTGVVYGDDSQIVTELLMKRFGEPARVEIEIQYQD